MLIPRVLQVLVVMLTVLQHPAVTTETLCRIHRLPDITPAVGSVEYLVDAAELSQKT